MFSIPPDADLGNAQFRVQAFMGEEAGTSRTVQVNIGRRPSLVASTDISFVVPNAENEVTLSWDTSGDAQYPATGVDVWTSDQKVSGTADNSCVGLDEPQCNTLMGAITIGVDRSTTWLVIARNEFGETRRRVGVEAAGTPAFVSITLDDEEVGGSVTRYEAETPTLAWSASNTLETELYAALPDSESGCDPPELTWASVQPFQGTASGVFELDDIGWGACLKLVAIGPSGSATEHFPVARTASVSGFEADPGATTGGSVVELRWTAAYESGIEIVSDHPAAVLEDELEACSSAHSASSELAPSDGEGHCDLTVVPGTIEGFTLTLYALDAVGERSDSAAQSIQIGEAPTIATLSYVPSEVEDGGFVVSWTFESSVQQSAALSYGDVVEEITGPGLAEDGGDLLIELEESTVVTLTAENPYGSDTANITIHPSGPVLESWTLEWDEPQVGWDYDSVDLLQGNVQAPHAEVGMRFEASAFDSYELYEGEPERATRCGEVEVWQPIISASEEDSISLDLERDTCYRLDLSQSVESNTYLVYVADIPRIDFFTGDQSTVSSEDKAVPVIGEVDGAVRYEVIAHYPACPVTIDGAGG
ncbi:MAG: hypothetical protein KC561_15525, partial [Myxococcales bacterium]|nr:hypothetical protein [Myxococcales bacterium]